MIELIYILVATHITIVCVTLFLHRGQAHLGLTFNPVVSHFMRFWLWLTTGMVTKEWVAVHRKHHRFTDKPEDPHSPTNHGLLRLLFNGVYYYKQAAKDKNMIAEYGKRTPDDWVENNIYTPYSWAGIFIVLPIIDLCLFGLSGMIVWLVQVVWIPFWAAGVINGLGHFAGYRNYSIEDRSTNIFPWGILIGGEELHNNHHQKPYSPKLSHKIWEFDIGWLWITILNWLHLVKINA